MSVSKRARGSLASRISGRQRPPSIASHAVRSKSMEEDAGLNKRVSASTSFDLDFDTFRHKLDRKPMLLRINVSGTSFILMHKNVERYPLSRLYHLVCEEYRNDFHDKVDGLLDNGEYFFDRSAVVFEAVAGFYRSGVLHKPENVCSDEFIADTMYYGILPQYIECLCIDCSKYLVPLVRMRQSDSTAAVSSTDETLAFLQQNNDYEKANGTANHDVLFLDNTKNKHIEHMQKTMSLQCYKYYELAKNAVWEFLEHPETSNIAMVAASVSVIFILATVIIMVMESMPQFQVCQNVTSHATPAPVSNFTLISTTPAPEALSDAMRSAEDVRCECSNTPVAARCNQVIEDLMPKNHQEITASWTCICHKKDRPANWCPLTQRVSHHGLDMADTVVIAWFTIEYILRLWSAPKRLKFMRDGMSLIDLASIFPFYLEQVLRLSFSGFSARSMQFTRGIRIIRLFRILRLLKLSRYSKGMQILGLSLKRSAAELGLMLFYTMLTTMFFSSLLYYLESDASHSTYKTIPDAAWWSMVSLFGYADAPPVTTGGKLVAAAGTMAGVILLALPITIIVDKFGRTYEELQHTDPGPKSS